MGGMDLVLLLASAVDPVPEAEDVRAGWGAFWLFVALVAATALLMWSFVRQIRKTRANAERGVFGPVERPEEPTEREHRVEQDGETRG